MLTSTTEAKTMFATTMDSLSRMPRNERIQHVSKLLQDDWAPDERGRLTLVLVDDLHKTGELAGAAAELGAVLACSNISAGVRFRLLLVRAAIEVDRGDAFAALETLNELTGYEQAARFAPYLHGVRARAMGLNGDREALVWFRKSTSAFVAADDTESAVAFATWAAITALDLHESVDEWLQIIPESEPYRQALGADKAFADGDYDAAARMAAAVLECADADSHARARALLIQANLLHESDADTSAYLAEQALALASQPAGIEPSLLARIRHFQLHSRKGD